MSHLIRTLNILVTDLLESDGYFYVAFDPYPEYLSHLWTVTFMSRLIRTLNILVTDLLDSDGYFYVPLDPYPKYLSHLWTVTFMSQLIRPSLIYLIRKITFMSHLIRTLNILVTCGRLLLCRT